jgi:ABC-type branched-subunit amino acid transport system substrate-binding protein
MADHVVPKKVSPSRRRKIAIAASMAVVIAAAGYGIVSLADYRADVNTTCMNAGATVVTKSGPGGECVGVTDGSYLFDPANRQLTAVERAIAHTDSNISGRDAGYASVAYLMAISDGGGVQSVQTVAEQLEGAYAAQVYADRPQSQGGAYTIDGSEPLIRLLIASDGLQALGWPTAVNDIERDVTSQDVAAVAGIGVSLQSTMQSVLKLTRFGIPVVGSSITSDQFDNIPNLVRVSSSNREEVDAVLGYIKPRFQTGTLVEDTNSHDSYDTTLVSEFSRAFPTQGHSFVDEESYKTVENPMGSVTNAGYVATRIDQMPTDICQNASSVVLFAGRGRDLATLITALADRDCKNKTITIATGDDVTDLPITPGVKQGLASGVRLFYAGDASPHEWSKGSGTVIDEGRQGYSAFRTVFAKLFPGVSTSDGNAMMGYDAMLTTISAIRLASTQNPTTSAVVQELNALHNERAVLGASGPIELSANYRSGTGSNPANKAVPIMFLPPSGQAQFVQLDWPDRQSPPISP